MKYDAPWWEIIDHHSLITMIIFSTMSKASSLEFRVEPFNPKTGIFSKLIWVR